MKLVWFLNKILIDGFQVILIATRQNGKNNTNLKHVQWKPRNVKVYKIPVYLTPNLGGKQPLPRVRSILWRKFPNQIKIMGGWLLEEVQVISVFSRDNSFDMNCLKQKLCSRIAQRSKSTGEWIKTLLQTDSNYYKDCHLNTGKRNLFTYWSDQTSYLLLDYSGFELQKIKSQKQIIRNSPVRPKF